MDTSSYLNMADKPTVVASRDHLHLLSSGRVCWRRVRAFLLVEQVEKPGLANSTEGNRKVQSRSTLAH